MENRRFDVTIPFPAWEGMHLVNEVYDEIRRSKAWEFEELCIPKIPRRITMQSGKPVEGFDDVKILKCWYTMGTYVTATLVGTDDDHYGASWKLHHLEIRWIDQLDHKATLQVGADDLEVLMLMRNTRQLLDKTDSTEVAKHKSASVAGKATIARLAGEVKSVYRF